MSGKMSLEAADAIRQDWGKFLELTNGNLMMIFLAKIPESLLPYPKEAIEEALNIVAEFFYNKGDTETVNLIQATIPYLMSYVSDEEALENVSVRFGKEEYLKAILPHLNNGQKNQLEYVLKKYQNR